MTARMVQREISLNDMEEAATAAEILALEAADDTIITSSATGRQLEALTKLKALKKVAAKFEKFSAHSGNELRLV
jgi:hypothetical protein